jgi:hypothetical protein
MEFVCTETRFSRCLVWRTRNGAIFNGSEHIETEFHLLGQSQSCNCIFSHRHCLRVGILVYNRVMMVLEAFSEWPFGYLLLKQCL